jgi:hypothetical protein
VWGNDYVRKLCQPFCKGRFVLKHIKCGTCNDTSLEGGDECMLVYHRATRRVYKERFFFHTSELFCRDEMLCLWSKRYMQ